MPLQRYSLSGSPFGRKTQLALKHLGVSHATTMLSADRGALREANFLALNPHGKLPVIVDRETTLSESEVIVEYLEDAHPRSGASLWPRPVWRTASWRLIARAPPATRSVLWSRYRIGVRFPGHGPTPVTLPMQRW